MAGSTLLYSEVLAKVHKAKTKEQRPESNDTETERFRRFAYGN